MSRLGLNLEVVVPPCMCVCHVMSCHDGLERFQGSANGCTASWANVLEYGFCLVHRIQVFVNAGIRRRVITPMVARGMDRHGGHGAVGCCDVWWGKAAGHGGSPATMFGMVASAASYLPNLSHLWHVPVKDLKHESSSRRDAHTLHVDNLQHSPDWLMLARVPLHSSDGPWREAS